MHILFTFRGFDGLSSISGSKVMAIQANIIRGIPTNSLGNPYKIRGLSAITWGPETPGSRSRPIKFHIPA